MVDIVGAVNLMRPINALATMQGGEQLRAMQNANALAPIERDNLLARNDLMQAQTAGLQNEVNAGQMQEAARAILPMLPVIRESSDPVRMAKFLTGSPMIPESIRNRFVGADWENEDPAELMRDIDVLEQQLTPWVYANRGSTTPAALRTFDSLTAGLSSEDIERARRIELGLDAPAGTSRDERLAGDPDLAARVLALEGDRAAARQQGSSGGLNLTPGQLAVDKSFADDYVDWAAVGGFADVEKNIQQLEGVVTKLRDGSVNLTGTDIGNTPRFVLAFSNPEALDALEQVEEVVQRNLRLILGAQFTEREGTRLIERAYNPRLDESQNADRLERLMTSLTAAAQAKQSAADYFNTNGTLAGFGGDLASVEAIMGTFSPDLPPGVTEADIEVTMRENNMTREQVLEAISGGR